MCRAINARVIRARLGEGLVISRRCRWRVGHKCAMSLPQLSGGRARARRRPLFANSLCLDSPDDEAHERVSLVSRMKVLDRLSPVEPTATCSLMRASVEDERTETPPIERPARGPLLRPPAHPANEITLVQMGIVREEGVVAPLVKGRLGIL